MNPTKTIFLLLALGLFSASASAKEAAYMSTIVEYLLNDHEPIEVKPEPVDGCELPVEKPQPGLGSKNMCDGRGLMASVLNTRAFSLNHAGRTLEACRVIEKYLTCGFATDRDTKMCNDLIRSVENYGISANLIPCD